MLSNWMFSKFSKWPTQLIGSFALAIVLLVKLGQCLAPRRQGRRRRRKTTLFAFPLWGSD